MLSSKREKEREKEKKQEQEYEKAWLFNRAHQLDFFLEENDEEGMGTNLARAGLYFYALTGGREGIQIFDHLLKCISLLPVDGFAKIIHNIEQKYKEKKPSTIEFDSYILSIKPFFELLEFLEDSENLTPEVEEKVRAMLNAMPIFNNSLIPEDGLAPLAINNGAYSEGDMLIYIRTLVETMHKLKKEERAPSALLFFLVSYHHTITLISHHHDESLHIIINPKTYPVSQVSFDTELTAVKISEMFSPAGLTFMTTNIFAPQAEKELANQFIAAWLNHPKMRQIHKCTREKASLVDDRKLSWLHVTALDGGEETVVALLKAGADPNLPDDEGMTPLHLATQNNHANIVKHLLAHGADHTLRDEFDGFTPLHLAAQDGHLETTEVLLNFKARPNRRSDEERTSLFIAAASGHRKILNMLIEHGAKLEKRDKNGLTPLHIAILRAHPKTIRLLMQHGADITATSKIDIDTLLQYESDPACRERLSRLLQTKNYVVDGCLPGITVLHIAVFAGNTHLVNFLLSQGAHHHCEPGTISLIELARVMQHHDIEVKLKHHLKHDKKKKVKPDLSHDHSGLQANTRRKRRGNKPPSLNSQENRRGGDSPPQSLQEDYSKLSFKRS